MELACFEINNEHWICIYKFKSFTLISSRQKRMLEKIYFEKLCCTCLKNIHLQRTTAAEWKWFWVAGKNDAISWKFTNQWFSIHSKSIYGLQERVYRWCACASSTCKINFGAYPDFLLSFLSMQYVGIDGNKTFIHNIFLPPPPRCCTCDSLCGRQL